MYAVCENSWIHDYRIAKRCSYTVFNTGIKFHTGELYLIWWIRIALDFIKGFEKHQDCGYFWKELYEPKYITPYYNATSIVLKPILDADHFSESTWHDRYGVYSNKCFYGEVRFPLGCLYYCNRILFAMFLFLKRNHKCFKKSNISSRQLNIHLE